MKKLSRKRKRLLIISGGVLLLLVLVILTVRGVHHLTSPRVDTEQGIQYIKAAESEDTAIIEQKIAQLESQDSQEGDTRSNKEKFTGSVVMGDSITEGFTEYDVLNASSVVSKIGVHLTELDDQIQRVVGRDAARQGLFSTAARIKLIFKDGGSAAHAFFNDAVTGAERCLHQAGKTLFIGVTPAQRIGTECVAVAKAENVFHDVVPQFWYRGISAHGNGTFWGI